MTGEETHHSKFILVQMSIFINVTQIPDLTGTMKTPQDCYHGGKRHFRSS